MAVVAQGISFEALAKASPLASGNGPGIGILDWTIFTSLMNLHLTSVQISIFKSNFVHKSSICILFPYCL